MKQRVFSWLAIGGWMFVSPAACAHVTAEPVREPHEEVSQTRLMGYLRALPEERSPMGSPRHVEGLVETERWIRVTLEDMGYEVHEQTIMPFEPPVGGEIPEADRVWRNLWVEIEGTSRGGEMLIVGAHFDAVATSPGADDNGTGTAGALELARVLAGRKPERTIRIVLFNLEETGLIGSTMHAQASIRPRIESGELAVVGMVSLEMLGYFSDEPDSQRSPIPAIPGVYEPRTVGDFIALVGTQRDQAFTRPMSEGMRRGAPGLNLFVFDVLPAALPDMRRSDQAPFWDIGVPAAMLTDTSNFRTPHYHRMSDRVETIDARRFTLVVRGVAAGIWELANPSAGQ